MFLKITNKKIGVLMCILSYLRGDFSKQRPKAEGQQVIGDHFLLVLSCLTNRGQILKGVRCEFT